VLRDTRRAHSARRAHKPPSIPAHERPPAMVAAERAQLDRSRFQDDQARARRAGLFPRAFRSVGRRKDMQFFAPAQLLSHLGTSAAEAAAANPALLRPPLHPSSRPASAALRSAVANSAAANLSAAHSAAAAATAPAPLVEERFFADYPSSLLGAALHAGGEADADFGRKQQWEATDGHAFTADWERVDVVEEGTREEMRMHQTQQAAAATEQQQDGAPQQEQQEAKEQGWTPQQLSPRAILRPASAHIVFGASTAARAPMAPAPPSGARPTSAFPRPPSAHTNARTHRAVVERPQSAVMPSVL